MLDRFQGLQVLVKTVELGSLSAAARAMNMSATMATKHVAALEDRLGTKLLHRTTRRITPTETGRAYVDAAERVLGELAEADATASSDNVVVAGMLRVSVPVTYGVRELAPRIPAFCLAHPKLTVDLNFNDRTVDLVEEGWDMAIRIGRLADSSLVARRLGPCRMAVCASPSYLARAGRPRRIAELRDHACMGYTLSAPVGPTSWSFGANGEVSVPIDGPLRASSGDALVEAAIAGLGIVYQPEFIVQPSVDDGRLVRLELDHEPMEMGGIFAVYPPHRRVPAKVRVFIDYLVERLREHESGRGVDRSSGGS